MKILTVQIVLTLHKQLIDVFGGLGGVRDYNLLESAVNAPLQTYNGIELYPTLIDKAARLCFGLVKNHPFIDGNKRIGAHAALVFLALNDIEMKYDDNELVELIMSVAAGDYDYEDILKWLRGHTL